MVLVRPAEAAAVQNDTSDMQTEQRGGRLSEPCVLPVHAAEGAHGCRMGIVTPRTLPEYFSCPGPAPGPVAPGKEQSDA